MTVGATNDTNVFQMLTIFSIKKHFKHIALSTYKYIMPICIEVENFRLLHIV